MNAVQTGLNDGLPAGGQTLRLPGSARSVTLHEQLYRYADDLQALIERNTELAADNAELRQSTERLLGMREELEAIVLISADIHLITDARGRILESNPAAILLAPAEQLVGSLLASWIPPSHHAEFLAMHSNAMTGTSPPEAGYELHLARIGAAQQPLIANAKVLAVSRGTANTCLHWIFRDVTHLRETEFETRLAKIVFKNSHEAVMITDVEGGILAVNAAFTRITGYSEAEALGRNPNFLSSGHQSPEFYESFWHTIRTLGTWQGRLYNRRKSGGVYLERLTVTAVRDAEGRTLSYIAVFSDVSEPAPANTVKSPQHDPLTGIAGSSLLDDRLERLAALSRRLDMPFSLIRIDLDAFHRVNAQYGFLAGDGLLREVAHCLTASLCESDTVARVGGDDFVVLAPGLVGEANLDHFCAKLRDALRTLGVADPGQPRITASIGCASFPEHAGNTTDLLSAAEKATQQAKSAGGDRHIICSCAATPSAAGEASE